MSTTNDDSPNPRNDPEAVIRERFAGRRDVVKKVAELDLGELSEDAETVLEILDQEEGSDR